MQPMVAISYPPAGPMPAAIDTESWQPIRCHRPAEFLKAVMVQSPISDLLTIIRLEWSQLCLRQGCTLLATYKCTLPTFLAQVRGLKETNKEWSQRVIPLVNDGAF